MRRFEPPPLPSQQPPLPGAQPAGAEPANPYAPPNPWAETGPAPATTPPMSGLPSVAGPRPLGSIVLTLGILSVALAQFLGPVAWGLGRSALAEVDLGVRPDSERSALKAGMILGMVGTGMLVLGVLAGILLALFVIAA